MYSTCLFCRRHLGKNEVIEQFPVGRRLAFDAAKGRLWVVCTRCRRWNLTPLEERWEAIEDVERRFRETRLRVSTGEIGLARLPEGLELVRVGAPQRPEIAAWRYGEQLGRRRRLQMIGAGSVLGAGGLALAGGLAAGLGVVVAWQAGRMLYTVAQRGNPLRIVARTRVSGGRVISVRTRDLARSRLSVGSDGGIALDVTSGGLAGGRAGFARQHHLEGAEARRVLASVLPVVNRLSGTPEEIEQAAGRLDRAGSAARFLADQARRGSRITRVVSPAEAYEFADWEGAIWQSGLFALSPAAALAIEMALNEEQERRALEGELAELEAAWREAEEIGAIADAMFLPEAVERALARIRGDP